MGYSKNEQNRSNNDRGRMFENLVNQGCQYYKIHELAMIEKTPEPFRVKKKNKDGTFKGRFTGLAQPDYKGTIKGGQAIAFEVKMTSTDRLKKSVVTNFQATCLNYHFIMGAYVGVCCLIGKTVGFIPWDDWMNMKEIFGRQYILEDELKKYQVPTPGYIDFLCISEVLK